MNIFKVPKFSHDVSQAKNDFWSRQNSNFASHTAHWMENVTMSRCFNTWRFSLGMSANNEVFVWRS